MEREEIGGKPDLSHVDLHGWYAVCVCVYMSGDCVFAGRHTAPFRTAPLPTSIITTTAIDGQQGSGMGPRLI